MPKGDYIIPIIKGGGKNGVKAFANLRTKEVVKTGTWDETPNCLVSEYCQKPRRRIRRDMGADTGNKKTPGDE